MPSVLLVVQSIESGRPIQSALSCDGLLVRAVLGEAGVMDLIVRDSPELVMVEANGKVSQQILRDLTRGNKITRKVPVIALLTVDLLDQFVYNAGLDDFVVWPCDGRELALRARRVIQQHARLEESIICGDLVLDLINREVRVKGKLVELTFKEYELLKCLAGSRGRVFTRDALLNRVWGFDYFGGDRTVDVHITRLRSKIEISGQPFIETVRNIGYRFKKE